MKITKNKYLAGFMSIVVLLAFIRLIFPSVAADRPDMSGLQGDTVADAAKDDSLHEHREHAVSEETTKGLRVPEFFGTDGREKANPIFSVHDFGRTFPDNQDVQMQAASHYGVSPVENRQDAEGRKKELVYIGVSPYFYVDRLPRSIPYLVPRAAVLLNDIGRTYFDSLQIKGIPLHKIIVTSVLRTREDIRKLRNHNGNATENSCHLYGTTFDISYNRYKTVSDPDLPKNRSVRNDSLKWVLSEVLRDMRNDGRCYIKYEVKQGCFHVTVR